MIVLNVAEKNDAAKSIAGFLSRGACRRREGLSVYNKIFDFTVRLWNENCDMIMTSVSGHLLSNEFLGYYRSWQGCHPLTLFDAPVTKCCPEDNTKVKQTLEREVRKCNALIIWTDCDREGENIGFEIINVCTAIKRGIRVYRAKFSEITQISIERALQNLCEPNVAVSNAVDVRSELDLRIGAAFTRFQTLRLQKVFPSSLGDMLISYGSCQFPTLGFVVERFLAIERFIPEPYWKLKVTDVHDDISVEFHWARVRLFEQLPCEIFLDMCLEQPQATVRKVTSKPKSKWRPLPLDTVELEKQGSRKLRLTAKETMKIAEKLYSQGLISYPRTETNIFPDTMNLASLVSQQVNSSAWGQFAQQVLNDGPSPRAGKKSDQAHPPIHPTKYADNLQGNEAKVYEFVVRHFLACVSNNAVGQETIVEIDIAGEKFTADGLQIIAKNYLNVYIYEKWNNKEIHAYQEGQVFRPTTIDMIKEETSPPELLTEADLIALMDKYGIGTDATHAEHIDTIKARNYIGSTDGEHLIPGKLGIGLVMGYDSMGFQMSKPNLRADLENDLKLICDRQKDPKEVLQTQINKYREVFKIAIERANLIDNALANYLEERPIETVQFDATAPDVIVFKCPKCGESMVIKDQKQGRNYIGCMGFPGCKNAIWFPPTVESVGLLNEVCTNCSGNMRKLLFKLSRNAYPLFGTSYTTCIGGCDPLFNETLRIKRETVRITQRTNDSGYNSMSDSSRSTVVSNVSQVRSNRNERPLTESGVNSSRTVNASTSTVRNQNSNRNNVYALQNANSNAGRQNNRGNNNNLRTSASTSNSSGSRTNPSDDKPVWGVIHQDDVIMCACNVKAVQFTVKKQGPNQGRSFYKCAKSKGTDCNLFVWATDEPMQNDTTRSSNQTSRVDASTSRSLNATTVHDSRAWGPTDNTINPSNQVVCNCNQSAKQWTVQKEGPNKGRKFYNCQNARDNGCQFFQWADENAQSSNVTVGRRDRPSDWQNDTRGTGASAAKRPRATGKRKCGICGMEGHTRRTCSENVMD